MYRDDFYWVVFTLNLTGGSFHEQNIIQVTDEFDSGIVTLSSENILLFSRIFAFLLFFKKFSS